MVMNEELEVLEDEVLEDEIIVDLKREKEILVEHLKRLLQNSEKVKKQNILEAKKEFYVDLLEKIEILKNQNIFTDSMENIEESILKITTTDIEELLSFLGEVKKEEEFSLESFLSELERLEQDKKINKGVEKLEKLKESVKCLSSIENLDEILGKKIEDLNEKAELECVLAYDYLEEIYQESVILIALTNSFSKLTVYIDVILEKIIENIAEEIEDEKEIKKEIEKDDSEKGKEEIYKELNFGDELKVKLQRDFASEDVVEKIIKIKSPEEKTKLREKQKEIVNLTLNLSEKIIENKILDFDLDEESNYLGDIAPFIREFLKMELNERKIIKEVRRGGYLSLFSVFKVIDSLLDERKIYYYVNLKFSEKYPHLELEIIPPWIGKKKEKSKEGREIEEALKKAVTRENKGYAIFEKLTSINQNLLFKHEKIEDEEIEYEKIEYQKFKVSKEIEYEKTEYQEEKRKERFKVIGILVVLFCIFTFGIKPFILDGENDFPYKMVKVRENVYQDANAPETEVEYYNNGRVKVFDIGMGMTISYKNKEIDFKVLEDRIKELDKVITAHEGKLKVEKKLKKYKDNGEIKEILSLNNELKKFDKVINNNQYSIGEHLYEGINLSLKGLTYNKNISKKEREHLSLLEKKVEKLQERYGTIWNYAEEGIVE